MFTLSKEFIVLAHIWMQWIKIEENLINSSIKLYVMFQGGAF